MSYSATTGQYLEVANGQQLTVHGKGDLTVPGTNGLMLMGAWHVPGIASNLVSLGQLEDKGIAMRRQPAGNMILEQNGQPIANIERICRLYILAGSTPTRRSSSSASRARSSNA